MNNFIKGPWVDFSTESVGDTPVKELLEIIDKMLPDFMMVLEQQKINFQIHELNMDAESVELFRQHITDREAFIKYVKSVLGSIRGM